MIAPNYNKLSRDIHAAYGHWWVHLETGQPIERDRGEIYMLMVSEVAEAMEGERKSLMDDKLRGRPMAEVEMADVMIRILDYAGHKKMVLDGDRDAVYLPTMPSNKAAALLQIVRELTRAQENNESPHWETWRLQRVIGLVERYCAYHGYDLQGAIDEKHAFNLVREDHKVEARKAANGKKF